MVVEPTGEVFGEAQNIAARVQAVAEPGVVVVTANVHRQVTGLFVAEDKGAHELQGVAEPVMLYHVVRASGGRRRASARPLTPFVGREEELGLLMRRWERAQAGEGQLVLIVGEPGIGKSRLVEEFRAKLVGTSHTWVEWSALQLLQNTPLHPIAEWGRIRFETNSPAEQRLADLENTLGLIGLDPANMPRCWPPSLTSRCRPAGRRICRPKSCGGGSSRRSSHGPWRERGHKPSGLHSRTCNGQTRRRSSCCKGSLSAARRRGS